MRAHRLNKGTFVPRQMWLLGTGDEKLSEVSLETEIVAETKAVNEVY